MLNKGRTFSEEVAQDGILSYGVNFDTIPNREATDTVVFLNDVLQVLGTDYTLNNKVVTFNSQPTVGNIVGIYRDSSYGERLIKYTSSQVVTKDALEKDSLQDMYLAEEAMDRAWFSIQYSQKDGVNYTDHKNYTLRNLGTPAILKGDRYVNPDTVPAPAPVDQVPLDQTLCTKLTGTPEECVTVENSEDAVPAKYIKVVYESFANTNAFDDTYRVRLDRITISQPINLDDLAAQVGTNVTDIAANLAAIQVNAQAIAAINVDVLASKQVTDLITITQDVNLDTMESKLDNIEDNATADMTPLEIKTAYESNLDTNEFNDAEKAKLAALSQLGGIAEWTSGAAYVTDMLIWEGTDFYRAIDDHTSGATFVGDAAHWEWFSAALDDTKVAKTGDTMTGPLVLQDTYLDIGATATNTHPERGSIWSGLSRMLHGFSWGDNGTVTPDGNNIFMGGACGNVTLGETATSSIHASNNVGFGSYVLRALTIGYNNIAQGFQTMMNLTTGYSNVGVGNRVLENGTTARLNVAIGESAMRAATSAQTNVAIGNFSLFSSLVGSGNTTIGYNSAFKLLGSTNTGVGREALNAIVSGTGNVAMGYRAGKGATGSNASYNVSIGRETGATVTGNFNTFLGDKAGETVTSGDSNILIGSNIQADNISGDNQLNIGNLLKGDMTSGSEELSITGTTKVSNLEIGGVSTVPFEQSDADKLDGLQPSLWLGEFADEAALNLAHPTALAGNTANINGVGVNAQGWLWDADDSKWVLGTGTPLSAAEIEALLYDGSRDNNKFTDAEKVIVADNETNIAKLVDINTDTKEPSGFIDDANTLKGVIEYSLNGTDVFQIDKDSVYSENSTGLWHDGTAAVAGDVRLSPVDGANPITYYIKGVKHELTTGVSCTGTAASNGLHLMYLDGTETLKEALAYSSSLITDNALVAVMYWNADHNEMVDFGDERHGIDMDGATHKWLHENVGARYKGGMAIQGLSDGGNTFTQIDSGNIDDEDLSHTCQLQTTAPYWYMDNAHWRTVNNDNLLGYTVSGDTGVSYNLDTAGVFTLEEVTGNDCIIMFTMATHNAPNKYVRIIGQNLYARASHARAAIASEVNNLKLNGLPTPEFIFVNAYIINAAGEIKLDDEGNTHLDLRTSDITGLGVNSTATVHANTTNRDAINSHPATAISFDPTISRFDPTDTTAQKGIDAAALRGGLGDTSVFKVLDAEVDKVSDWTVTGNTVLSEETVAPLKGKTSYKYTQGPTSSVGDKATSPVIDVPIQARDGNTCKLKLRYTLTGANDEDFGIVIRGAALDVVSSTLLKAGGTRVTKAYTLGSNTEIYAQVFVNQVNDGADLVFDSLEFSDKFGEYGSVTVSETITYTGYTSRTGLNRILLPSEDVNMSNSLLKVDNVTYADHTRYTFIKESAFTASASISNATAGDAESRVQLVDKNDVIKLTTVNMGAYNQNSGALTGLAEIGDYLIFSSNSAGNNDYRTNFSVTATAQSDTVQFEDSYQQGHVVASFKLEGNGGESITANTENIPFAGTGLGWVSGTGLEDNYYVVQKDDTIVNLNLGIKWGSTDTYNLYLFVNNTTSIQISANEASGAFQDGTYVSQRGEFSAGDKISFRTNKSHTLTNATSHYLSITETYLPPVEQASTTRMLAVKSSLENDFDVDAAGTTGVLSGFNPVDEWCTLTSKTSQGVYTYTLNQSIFTTFPRLWTEVPEIDARIGSIYYGTFPVFTVHVSASGTPTDDGFTLFAKKRGADRSDRHTPVVNGDDVVFCNHKTTEFDTGETAQDGRVIFGRSFALVGSFSNNDVLTTIDTGLEMRSVTISGLSGTQYYNGRMSNYAMNTGEIYLEEPTNTFTTVNLEVRYVK